MTRRFSADELVIATHNRGKLAEIGELLKGRTTARLSTASDHGVEAPPETGTTFFENALIKALAVAKATGKPALADDSGLSIAALKGAPGVYSADWAEDADGSRDFGRAIARVQQEIAKAWGAGKSFPTAAHFTCCLALAWPDGHFEIVEGHVFGDIVFPPRGTNGFGYDPIFVAHAAPGQTFGEMDAAAKNAISHRADAFRQIIAKCF